jgi:hypothetical protein
MSTQMFVSGSLVEIVATFTPNDGGSEAPTSANAQFVWINNSGNTIVTNVPLTYQSTSGNTTTWVGSWNAAGVLAGSTVTWLVTSAGPLIAAATGAFVIESPGLVPAPPPAPVVLAPQSNFKPTLAGFQCWVQNIMGVPSDVYATSLPFVTMAYCVAISLVNPQLAIISNLGGTDCSNGPSIYAFAVYNLGGSNLINYAQDAPFAPNVPGSDPPAPYWQYLRQKFNTYSFTPGLTQSAHDESTGSSIWILNTFKDITLANLQQLKDPWGRAYLGIAQSWGTVWGLS